MQLTLVVAKKLFNFLGSFATPGGLLALCLAWIATRPDVQARVEALCSHALSWLDHDRATAHHTDAMNTIRVPVSRSRCNATITFRPIRMAA